jgi:PAS domain S-box-containing protein
MDRAPAIDLAMLFALADAAPVLLAYVDTDERYRFVNSGYERWFGHTRSQLIGRSVKEILGAGYPVVEHAVHAALAGETVRFEREIPYPTGGTRLVEAQYTPHLDDSGKVRGFIAMIHDVTDARRSEQVSLLRARLYALSLALSSAALPEQVGEIVVRDGGAALGAVSAALALLDERGTHMDVLVGAGAHDGADIRSIKGVPLESSALLAEVIRDRRIVHRPTRAALFAAHPRLADDSTIGESFVTVPLVVGDRILGAFGLGFPRSGEISGDDLSYIEALAISCALALERARLFAAERALRAEAERLRDAVRDERARLEGVLAQAPIGIAIADAPSGRLVMANRALEQIFRHRAFEAGSIDEYASFSGFHRDGRPYAPEEWPLSRSVLHGETVPREEATVVRGDGTRGHVVVSSAPIRDGDETVIAAVVVVQDVTAQHDALEEIERLAAFRQQILDIVSHDLRNPLQTTAMATSVLERAALSPLEARAVASIRASARRMTGLVDDLLDFARTRAGSAMPIAATRADLDAICSAVVDELRVAHPHHALELVSPGPIPGSWDPARLGQAIGNLVANAFSHGDRRRAIRVALHATDDHASIAVHNEGPPIPPELMTRIFEPYTRAREGGQGLGLGLFIARTIVEAHGGVIEASSSATDGTTFVIRLPRETTAPKTSRVGA